MRDCRVEEPITPGDKNATDVGMLDHGNSFRHWVVIELVAEPRGSAAAGRPDVGGQPEVPAHVAGQRVQHRSIGPGWFHVGLAKQCRQAVDVATGGSKVRRRTPSRRRCARSAPPANSTGTLAIRPARQGTARQAPLRAHPPRAGGPPRRTSGIDSWTVAVRWMPALAQPWGLALAIRCSLRSRATALRTSTDTLTRSEPVQGTPARPSAAHIDRDEVMGSGVCGRRMEGREAFRNRRQAAYLCTSP